jgi:hypothetical protein
MADAMSGLNSTNSSFAQHFLLAVPRLARRAGVFAINYLPEQLDGFFGKALMPARVIANATALATSAATNLSAPADPTSSLLTVDTGTNNIAAASASSPAANQGALAATSATAISIWSAIFSWETLRGVIGIGSYVTSKWALMLFGVVSYMPDTLP